MSDLPAVRIVLVDDHALVRANVRAMLEQAGGFDVVAEAGSGAEAVELVERHRPDIVLMDVLMPGMNGLDAMGLILQSCPSIRVIMLSMHAEEPYVAKAMRAGARGYLVKHASPQEILRGIAAVVAGRIYVTPLALEVGDG